MKRQAQLFLGSAGIKCGLLSDHQCGQVKQIQGQMYSCSQARFSAQSRDTEENQRACHVISCRKWKHSCSLITHLTWLLSYTVTTNAWYSKSKIWHDIDANVDCTNLTGVWHKRFWRHKIEMMPHICPSDLLCVLFSSQPLSVGDEQSEKCSKDSNTVHTTCLYPSQRLQ